MVAKFPIRLNKFIAHCGITDRRKAGQLVKDGLIRVNGKINTNPGYRVIPKDIVTYKGKTLFLKGEESYILINKPKTHACHVDKEQKRKNLGHILGDKIQNKLQVIGAFDDRDMGLILLSSDAEFNARLLNRNRGVDQQFKVGLKESIEAESVGLLAERLRAEANLKIYGIHLSDDPLYSFHISIQCPLSLSFRSVLEKFGFTVRIIDRIFLAGISKKNLSRGFFRPLNGTELRQLRYF